MREYLIQARAKAGLTQTQAAKKLLISQNYLSDIETGKRQKDLKLNVLKGCAKIYEVPLDTLIFGESEYQKKRGVACIKKFNIKNRVKTLSNFVYEL